MNTFQEPKYGIENGKIVNRQSGDVIPEDEPIFLLRARDRHAIFALTKYLQACEDASQREAVWFRINQFVDWAQRHPDRMKEPDSQLTPDWTNSGVYTEKP